jgi:hypothetical protein
MVDSSDRYESTIRCCRREIVGQNAEIGAVRGRKFHPADRQIYAFPLMFCGARSPHAG